MYCKIIIFLFIACFIPVQAAEVVVRDMAGRDVKCPSPCKVERIFATSHAMSCVLLALAPEKLCALNRAFTPEDKVYLGDVVDKKPVLGGWLGSGKPTNSESFLSLRPQIVFAPEYKRGGNGKKIQKVIKRFGIPLLYADINDLGKMPEALIFIGKVIGADKRASVLAAASKELLNRISKIGKNGVKVYYAAGPDGLSSYSGRSPETEVIYLAGAGNVLDKNVGENVSGKNRRVTVNIESLIKRDPDLIIVNSPATVKYIKSNPAWNSVSAVKKGRVYPIPLHPVSWVNRPPSFPRLLGVMWLANIIDSKAVTDEELNNSTKKFYKVFYNCELTDEILKKLLSGE